MAKYLLLRGWLVLLKTSIHCGLPIFLKVNHRLESRMQEICQSGSEGGAKFTFVPTPIPARHFGSKSFARVSSFSRHFQGAFLHGRHLGLKPWAELFCPFGAETLYPSLMLTRLGIACLESVCGR